MALMASQNTLSPKAPLTKLASIFLVNSLNEQSRTVNEEGA